MHRLWEMAEEREPLFSEAAADPGHMEVTLWLSGELLRSLLLIAADRDSWQ